MSADNGKLLASSTTFALLYKGSNGALIYGIDVREYEAQRSSYELLKGTLPTHWMPYGSTARDAQNWIVSHASSSTVNWTGWPNTTTAVCVSKFFYGMSSIYDPDTGYYLQGAEGMYGIKYYKCDFIMPNPMKITRATINVSTTHASGAKIPIDVAFNFSSTQNLSASQILDLPAYTLYGGSGDLTIGLDIPAGQTTVYVYMYAHSFDMAEPDVNYSSTTIRGLTNPSITKLYYTAGGASPSGTPAPRDLDWELAGGEVANTAELSGPGPYKLRAREDAYTMSRDGDGTPVLNPNLKYHYPVKWGTEESLFQKSKRYVTGWRKSWWLYSKEVPKLEVDELLGWVYYVFQTRPQVAYPSYKQYGVPDLSTMPTETIWEQFHRQMQRCINGPVTTPALYYA